MSKASESFFAKKAKYGDAWINLWQIEQGDVPFDVDGFIDWAYLAKEAYKLGYNVITDDNANEVAEKVCSMLYTTEKKEIIRGPLTDEKARQLFPQNEKWNALYDFCRQEGMSPTEALNKVLTAKIEGY